MNLHFDILIMNLYFEPHTHISYMDQTKCTVSPHIKYFKGCSCFVMNFGARIRTFPPHNASLMPLITCDVWVAFVLEGYLLGMGCFCFGGLPVGTGGVGTCCNLRDGTTKHSKRSSWPCHNSKFIQWYCKTHMAQSFQNISYINIIQKR